MSAEWGGPRNNDIPGAVNIPSSMILVSKYYSPIKGTRSHVEVIPGLGQGKISPKTSCGDRKKGSTQKRWKHFKRAKEST